MHLADGVLSGPVLAATSAAAALGVAIGLKRLTEERLPAAALMGAAFLVASAIHVPVGVGSVHLVLNGLAGLMLGWALFPVLCVSLLLQAVLFSFGGLSTLGTNLLILALPGVLVHHLLHLRVAGPGGVLGDGSRVRWLLAGICCGVVGVGGAALLVSLVLSASGGSAFSSLAALFVAAHVPVLIVDSLISGLALAMLVRLAPDAFA